MRTYHTSVYIICLCDLCRVSTCTVFLRVATLSLLVVNLVLNWMSMKQEQPSPASLLFWHKSMHQLLWVLHYTFPAHPVVCLCVPVYLESDSIKFHRVFNSTNQFEKRSMNKQNYATGRGVATYIPYIHLGPERSVSLLYIKTINACIHIKIALTVHSCVPGATDKVMSCMRWLRRLLIR